MDLFSLFGELRSKINLYDDVIAIDERIIVRNFQFASNNSSILPGNEKYFCKNSGKQLGGYTCPDNNNSIEFLRDMNDSAIEENTTFRYHVFCPQGETPCRGTIIMLHGFNEKFWYKYYPWAYKLAVETSKNVVLFPMSFHMNRAPAAWSEKNAMFAASNSHKVLNPRVTCSTLTNVAISSRLLSCPERIVWSGLQSYYDVIQLVDECKAGHHPVIASSSHFDFFAYSIGCLLAQVLMLTNAKGYFTGSKMAMFCGGSVFNKLTPINKFILDSAASKAIYTFLVDKLENHLIENERLRYYLTQLDEGQNFMAMINYDERREYREGKFKALREQMLAVTLHKDSVIPPHEVQNTMLGINKDTGCRVIYTDYPYEYKHEEPFPPKEALRNETDAAFRYTFGEFSAFLR